MKKIVFYISIIFFAFVLFSCKSKDVVSEDGLIVDESVENTDIEKNDDEELVEKKIADKGFIGWIDTGKKNPSYENGLIKIATNSKLGTFCIYAVDYDGKNHAVLSPLNEYTSSSFYLKAGKKVYKLAANEKVKTGTAELEDGIRIVYDIKNVATIVLEMNAFSSIAGRDADTLKLKVNVKNTGKRSETFALKAVLDTILGENGNYHFYNSEGRPIKNEMLLRSMRDDKWFVSKNDKASMQILLDGGDVTVPEFISLANYKTLEKAKWLPTMQAYGAFDTVLSYNNSAVGIIWPDFRLSPDDSYTTTFYISVALDGMTPNGYKYVYDIKTPKEKKAPVKAPVVVTKEKPEEKKNVELKAPVVVESDIPDVKKEESTQESEPAAAAPVVEEQPEKVVEEKQEEVVIPNIEFNVKNISKDHLTSEYIQSLIDRIADLEKAGSSANRGEILQLNAELDAILSILR